MGVPAFLVMQEFLENQMCLHISGYNQLLWDYLFSGSEYAGECG
jgi:hypothetical protein